MVSPKKNRILVIAPHADDELIGVGGSLLRWKSQGCESLIVLVSASDLRLRHSGVVISKSKRVSEFREAAKLLSTEDPIFLGLEDSRLDLQPLSLLVGKLDSILDRWLPDTVVYPEPSYHQDHQFVNKACTAALRPTKNNLPSRILTYEIPTSTWVGSGSFFIPNSYVDITELLNEKLRIFQEIYSSQFTEFQRRKLALRGLRDHATYRGLECGFEAAEAFKLLHERL